MRKVTIIAAAIAGLAFAGAADARSPIEGRWKKGNLQIDIRPCGATLCGTVVKASAKQQARAENGSGTELIGATLIKQIQPTGPKTYKARVFLADRNMHASGRIRQLDPNRLAVSGCVLAVICKSAQWYRVR
jgi:uncharacterized protein (DUF2147 family)